MTSQDAHSLAKSYIDSVLAAHDALGERSDVSEETYDAAVKTAEDAFRELCEIGGRKTLTTA